MEWEAGRAIHFLAFFSFINCTIKKVIPDSIESPFTLKFKVSGRVILSFSEKILRSMSTIDRKSSP